MMLRDRMYQTALTILAGRQLPYADQEEIRRAVDIAEKLEAELFARGDKYDALERERQAAHAAANPLPEPGPKPRPEPTTVPGPGKRAGDTK
jgi:hypothetical protein